MRKIKQEGVRTNGEMPINLTQEEGWASNILNGQITDTQAELQRTVAARDAYMKLLEIKYKASFDSATGQFKSLRDLPKKPEKGKLPKEIVSATKKERILPQ